MARAAATESSLVGTVAAGGSEEPWCACREKAAGRGERGGAENRSFAGEN